MKTFISYVVQYNGDHSHNSEVIDIKSPPYSYSADPVVSEVLKWAEKKQTSLGKDEKLIVLNMFKI
ncbi:MAG: hypothetical protein RJQ09_06595 [Cyclobacteriaceae bacterium]